MANVPLKTIKFPGLPDTYVVESGDPSLGITGATPGQIPVVKSVDENGNLTEWETTATPVTSVNDKTGAVSLSAADVGAATTSNINTALNRTNAVNIANSDYTTYMARGEALFSAETTPSVNGTIAWQYE